MTGPAVATIPRCRHCLKCPACGGCLVWGVEVTKAEPTGTGFDVQFCEDCELVTDRKWVGH